MSRHLPPKVTELLVDYNKRLEREKYVVFIASLAIWHFVGWTYALGALAVASWFALSELRREAHLNSILAQYQLGMLDHFEE